MGSQRLLEAFGTTWFLAVDMGNPLKDLILITPLMLVISKEGLLKLVEILDSRW
jgi:hypothetical protein